jgi:hypothetical protein
MSNVNKLSPSVFLSGGLGLLFDTFARAKGVTAAMQSQQLQSLGTTISQMAGLNEAAKNEKLAQAESEETQGFIQMAQGFTQGALGLGSAAAGFLSNRSAINAGEDEITARSPAETQISLEEEVPMSTITINGANEKSPTTQTSASAERVENAASKEINIEASNSPRTSGSTNKRLSAAEKEEADTKTREEASRKGMMKWNTWTNLLGPAFQNMSGGAFNAAQGINTAKIRQHEGYSGFDSGVMQVASQVVGLNNQYIQSRESQEQGLNQAIMGLISTSSAA